MEEKMDVVEEGSLELWGGRGLYSSVSLLAALMAMLHVPTSTARLSTLSNC
jgi:hypothetical protein